MKKILLSLITLASLNASSQDLEDKFYFIETTMHINEAPINKSETILTDTYSQNISKIKSIVLKAPRYCANETIVDRGGLSYPKDEISYDSISMQTTKISGVDVALVHERCAIEMSDIERSFAKAGYKVISWESLANTAKNENLTIIDVAQREGVDVLVKINSFERNYAKISKNIRFDRLYYMSNQDGVKLDRVKVSTPLAKEFDDYIKQSENILSSQELKKLSVTMHADVIDVNTKEVIWFYKHTTTQYLEAINTKAYVTLVCDGDSCSYMDNKKNIHQNENIFKSGSSDALSIYSRTADIKKAIYNSLLEKSSDNLVNDFKNGTLY